MRVIESKIIQAIRNRKGLKTGHSSNMSGYRDVITISPAGFSYRLWDHYIAISSESTKTLMIDDCGFATATTRSRLNAIFAALDIPVSCSVRKGKMVYYLNGKEISEKGIETANYSISIA